ncbi:MAG: MBL fold metallo-hydrolase [Chloroflexota bacterium]|nr:MAG: MBL fold metallo-hydrolase [Chloroflexota bacterium]
MPKVIILGSSNAIPDEDHENSHMALVGDKRLVLIDCVNNPIVRLKKAGLKVENITDLILTHFHPDHVSGVPLLLMDLWLLGRQQELRIYGLDFTLDRLEKMMDLYGWDTWPRFFPVKMVRLPEETMTLIQDHDEWKIFSSPVRHIIPNIGLRIEFPESGKVFAYSGDTEPCPEVVELAQNADVLIHESTGASLGHTDADQAGEIAKSAGAEQLFLIHYANGRFKDNGIVARAAQEFSGSVGLAEDFMEFEF